MDSDQSDLELEDQSPYFLKALQSVKTTGSFAVGGSIKMPMPALYVHGIEDQIGLPVGSTTAKSIIEKCTRAPYGRGKQTIVDTAVRCSWQLDPPQFEISNPVWAEGLESLLNDVKADMGCDRRRNVSCQLYKLLLYEPGGFFKPHRDTEKVDGMFGTLVVQLISNFTGGVLIVDHSGQTKTFKFDGLQGSVDFHYTAFYADCMHEIKEVTAGYRLCLVYNLIYSGVGSTPAPVDNRRIINRVVSAIRDWEKDATEDYGPTRMVYLLEHKYSQAGLSFKALKNRDRAVSRILLEAQEQVDFDVYLAHVIVEQTWIGEKWGDDLCKERAVAKNFVSLHGELIHETLRLGMSVIVPRVLFKLVCPDKEHAEDTGNEGVEVEKSYHWTALILWPSTMRISMPGFNSMADKSKKAVKKREDRQKLEESILTPAVAQESAKRAKLNTASASTSQANTSGAFN